MPGRIIRSFHADSDAENDGGGCGDGDGDGDSDCVGDGEGACDNVGDGDGKIFKNWSGGDNFEAAGESRRRLGLLKMSSCQVLQYKIDHH